MDKLGEFSSQTERFLRSLARDLGLAAKKGEWLASNFGNESVSFDSEYAGFVSDESAIRGIHALELLSRFEPQDTLDSGLIDVATAAEFSQIGKVLDPDESFLLGVYQNGEGPQWREISYRHLAELRQLLALPIVSHGSVQGVVHAWHAGAEPPFFQLRELATGDLIHCTYVAELHREILRALERREKTVVHVYGRIRWERTRRHILDIAVDDVELTQPLSDAEFNRLFGSVPNFTGDMTTAEYIDWIRGGDDE